MDLGKKKAYEDFETIRLTLEQTKTGYNGLYKILLRYGIVQSILYLFSIVIGSLLKKFNGLGYVSFIFYILAAIYMAVYYFKVYNAENVTSNKYYLSCISMWGIIAIALPFIDIAVSWTTLALTLEEEIDYLIPKMQEFSMLINILLVCFCCIICGFIINKKILIILSIIILYVFLNLDLLYFNTNVSEIGNNIFNIFYYSCITIGYIGLSYMLRRKNKNEYK